MTTIKVYPLTVKYYNCIHNKNPCKKFQFTLDHIVTKYNINPNKYTKENIEYFGIDRNDALELINAWNKLGDGSYTYWID